MKQIIFILLAFVTHALIAQNCSSNRYIDPVFNTSITSGVYFGTANPWGIIPNEDLYMDIYMPTNDALTKRPVIIWAFGGAYLVGTRSQFPIPDYCTYYAERGYVCVSIDYRKGFNTLDGESAERAVYRVAQDIRSAQRFLADNAATYNIDIDAMFLTGSSAGCISGIHTAYMDEPERPASTYGTFLEPSDLGCIDCTGNSNYGNQRVPVKGVINHWGAIGDTSWIEATMRDNIPMLSYHGTADNVVPFGTGQPFNLPIWPTLHGSSIIHQRLSNNGVQNQLKAWPGVGHEPEINTSAAYLDSMYVDTTPWLYDIMQPEIPATIIGSTEVCEGTTTIYAMPNLPDMEYCWSITGGNILAQSNEFITVDWNTTGTYTITGSQINCNLFKSEDITLQVIVNPLPTISWINLPSVTTSTTPIALQATPTGGTFSGNGVVFNAFNPSLLGPGFYTITYEYADPSGCFVSDSQSILIGNVSYNFVNYNLGTINP